MIGDSAILPVEAHDVVELAHLEGVLHDWWIDVDALGYDRTAGQVVIPLEAEGRRLRFFGEGAPRAFSAQFVCRGVQAISGEDPEQIGSYTINTVRSAQSTLRLIAEPHLLITFDVDRIEICARPAPAAHVPAWAKGG